MKVYSRNTPNGVVELEGPDNATQDQIDLAFAEYIGSKQWRDTVKPGMLARAADMVTGNLRETSETRSLPEWTGMPELNSMSMASLKTAAGTLLTSPDETIQVIKAQYPKTSIRQDEKGNHIIKSSIDGKEYAIPPGMSVGDIPRVAAGLLSGTPAGRVTGVLKGGAAMAGTQAGIEASQAATGGSFDPEQVAIAGIAGAAVPAIGAAAGVVRNIKGQKKPPQANAVADDATEEAASVADVNKDAAQAAAAKKAAKETAKTKEDIRRAAMGGIGSSSATARVAGSAKLDKDAVAAADRLKMAVPADVFSDNQALIEVAGLSRSKIGSEASSGWRDAVIESSNRADGALESLGASTNLARMSDKSRDLLKETKEELESRAGAIYDSVDKRIPLDTKVNASVMRDTLSTIMKEMGGERGLKPSEKTLLRMVKDKNLTYGGFLREKTIIGQVLGKKSTAYADSDTKTLGRLYAAMAEDQLGIVEKIGGQELRDQLKGANALWAKNRELGDRIVNSFGKDLDGSISSLILRSVDIGKGGNSEALTKLIKTIPNEHRKEAVLTGIMAATRSNSGITRGGFGFAEYSKLYGRLKNNSPIYNQVMSVVGDDAKQVLDDLHLFSERMTAARDNTIGTGKANQEIFDDTLMEKILSGPAKRAATVTAAAAGGGPIAAGVASEVAGAIGGMKKDKAAAISRLLTSDEFNKLALSAAQKGKPSDEAIKATASSRAFINYAKTMNMPGSIDDYRAWLAGAFQSTQIQGDQ